MLNPRIKRIGTSGKREIYEFTSNKNEKVRIELSEVHCDPKDKNALPNIWKKEGYIRNAFYDYITIQVQVNNEYGAYRKYNPQYTKSGRIIFRWILSATPSNKERILNEVWRLANVGTTTATRRRDETVRIDSKPSVEVKIQAFAKSIKDSVTGFGKKIKNTITEKINKIKNEKTNDKGEN